MLLLVYRKKWFLSGEMLIYFYFYFKWRESTAESACIAAWVGAIWRKSTRETNPEVFSRQQKKQGTNLVIVLAKGLCSRLTSEWAASLSQNRRLVVSAVPRTGLARTQISAFCVSSFAREKVPRGGGGLEHAKSILLQSFRGFTMTTTADEVTKLEPRKEEGNNSVKRREGWPKLEWKKKNHPGLIRHSSSLFAVLLFFQISNFSMNIYFPAYYVQETIFNSSKFGESGNWKMGGGGT